MSSALFFVENKHNQLVQALQGVSALRDLWPSLSNFAAGEDIDQKTQSVVETIIGARSCLAYAFEQNQELLPIKTREVALKLLSEEGNPFDKGRFGKILGQGLYGVVQKVKVAGDFFAAKKLIKPDAKAFNREYQLLIQFDHPNIIKVMHAVSDILYLEFADKGCLNVNSPPGKLDRVLLQIARGLNYLHDKQYVHRDIKPENVLVMKDGQLKIADFGLMIVVKEFKEKKGGDFSDSFHLPPEHRFHKVKPKDCQKIDVWSFGYCISLFLLKKKEPAFLSSLQEAKQFSGFKKNDLKERFDSKKLKQHDSKGFLTELTLKCFACIPANRPTMGEIVKDLEGLESSFSK